MHSSVALNETEQHAQYFLSLLSQQCDMHAGRLARCCTVFKCRQHALFRVYSVVLLRLNDVAHVLLPYADVVTKGKQIHAIKVSMFCFLSQPETLFKADKSQIND